MATTRLSYRDASHPSFNETIKAHNARTLKLVRMVAEFAQTVSSAQEQFALQICTMLKMSTIVFVVDFRPISCQDSLLAAWECIVQETLVDGQSQAESASLLVKNIASPLLEIASYKKSQTKKLLSFREAFEYHLDEAKDRIQKVYMDTFQTYNNKQSSKPSHAAYLNAHNDYVLQIRSSNSLLREYTTTALPLLLEELEEIHIDLSNTLSAALESYAISRHSQAGEQSHRYSGAAKVCKRVDPTLDVHDFLDAMQQQEPFSKPFAYNQQSFSIVSPHPVYRVQRKIVMDPR
ncbi:hypothetical protein CAPTEDRAFT_105504 [Capitella teleta]|uniref:BAR domain-containing protein n=1 Tax=Capitella teleta TaxID=283909 RepID=R7UJT1_CAPTE|nr:hypothetical protein CAPTEDRAFT_105504 [Capitella teleta]|eukprot:ELU06814.1 hypothetical protein CAPTEDRAFT_105504 [Capitella teleta]